MKAKEKKSLLVKEIVEKLKICEGTFFVKFEGLSVPDFIELRREIKNVGGEAKVVKNTLLKRAINALSLECDEAIFKEPTLAVFAYEDAVGIAKVINKAVERFEGLRVKGGFYNLEYLSAERFNTIASLPSKDELIAKLIFLVESPLRRVIGGVKGPCLKIVTLIYNIKKLKEEE